MLEDRISSFVQYHKWASEVQRGKGRVPVADYKVVANFSEPESTLRTSDEVLNARGCYSFCMCPGGQVWCPSRDSLLANDMFLEET